MRIAIHQPLFIPWFPYFEKMARCDKFVILTDCQFEKNSNMNRQKVFNKWWTKPVVKGLQPIIDKRYVSGQSLLAFNVRWIYTIAYTLNIDAGEKIVYDIPTEKKKTERIVEICQHYGADEYLADAKAPEKYLDIKTLEEAGIRFVPFKSKNKKHVFEMFAEYGIEKTINILNYGNKTSKKAEESRPKRSPETGKEGSRQPVAGAVSK